MKRLGLSLLIAVLVLGLSVFLAACGGGGGGGGTPDTPIADNTQGTQAASSSVQAGNMAQGTSQTFMNLSNIGLSSIGSGAPQLKPSSAFTPSPAMKGIIEMSRRLAQSTAANASAASMRKAAGVFKSQIMSVPTTTSGSSQCSGGGTASWVLSVDNTAGTVDGNITFANCREVDTEMNGVYGLSASANNTSASLTITLAPFSIKEYANGSQTPTATMTMTDFVLNVGASIVNNSMTMTISTSGSMDFNDAQNTYSISFSNYSNALTIDSSAATVTVTANGGFSETWNSQSVSASYSSFTMVVDDSQTDETISLSGSFTINFTPDNCLNGKFSFVTNTPITINSVGDTIAGEIVINGATTLTFNSDNSVTVTTAGASMDYATLDALATVCPIGTLQ